MKHHHSANITEQQALELYQNRTLSELCRRAGEITEELHDPCIRTYVIERNINYTNVCSLRCRFCAFSVSGRDESAYILDDEQMAAKIEELIALGGTQILLQGGCRSDLPFAWYEEMLQKIKVRFSRLHIHGFSPVEIVFFADRFEKTIEEVIQRLMQAGLDTIPGGGAEILVDRVRRIISPAKCNSEQWFEVMRRAHGLGLCTTATMMFGHVESIEERIEHLERIRQLQSESLARREKNPGCGCFTAFTCWPFQADNTRLGKSLSDLKGDKPGQNQASWQPAGSFEQLKMTALARIYLHNIPNMQASWVTQGSAIGQLSLSGGCNDLGSLMMEENVVAAAGTTFQLSLEQLRRLIQDAGYTAVQRDCFYNLLESVKTG